MAVFYPARFFWTVGVDSMNHYWVDKDRALQRANLNEDSQGQGTGTSVLRTPYGVPTYPS